MTVSELLQRAATTLVVMAWAGMSVAAGTQAPGAPPPAAAPAEDPRRLELEERLKELQRRETAETDPKVKADLLQNIIAVCIELGRDYASYEARLSQLRAELERQRTETLQEREKAQQNEREKQRAIAAITRGRLDEAAAAVAAALALYPADPQTLALQARVDRSLRNRLMYRVSLGSLLVLAVGAVTVAAVKRVRGRGATRRLEVVEGPEPGEIYSLNQEKIVVGALAGEADIVVNDVFHRISRRHCEIARTGRHYFLTDTSTNGTRINGKTVPHGEPVLLRKGDTIALAEDVVLRFR